MDALHPGLFTMGHVFPWWRRCIEALEPIRKATGYDAMHYVAPESGVGALAAAGIVEQRFSLLPLSVIWAISGSASAAAGFRAQITDLATGHKFHTAKVNSPNLSGIGFTQHGLSTAITILPIPIVITEPGMVSVTIENLAAVANTCQLVLHVAEPEWLRPDSTLIYRPNHWNKEIERAAELIKRAVRPPIPGATSSTTGATVPGTEGELRNAPINTAVAGDNVIVPGVPGSKIEVYELFLWNVAAQALTLRNGAELFAGPFTAFPAASGIFLPFTGEPHFECTTGNSFILNLGAATQVSGWAKYRMVT